MTTMTNTLIASLDITGSSRAWDMTYVRSNDGVVHHMEFGGNDKLADAIKWVGVHQPALIAIDAPSGRNRGRTTEADVRELWDWKESSYRDMRLCEADLRCRGIEIYSTLKDEQKAAKWVSNGWELYSGLRDELGYSTLSASGLVTAPSRPTIIEIYPYSSFVVGLGWKPNNKESLPGQLERVAFLLGNTTWNAKQLSGDCLPHPDTLNRLAVQLTRTNWEAIREKGLKLTSFGHDVLDSLVGLVTAIRVMEGRAWAVGDPTEGMIIVPGELRANYRQPERDNADAIPLD